MREHLGFCFVCIGRTLEPRAHAAIVLREVLGYGNREAAQMIGVSESVLRHSLAEGRRTMRSTYEGLCALVNKDGVCRQCASFHRTVERTSGPPPPTLDPDDAGWQRRLQLLRERHFAGGSGSALHRLLFARIRRIEDEAP